MYIFRIQFVTRKIFQTVIVCIEKEKNVISTSQFVIILKKAEYGKIILSRVLFFNVKVYYIPLGSRGFYIVMIFI